MNNFVKILVITGAELPSFRGASDLPPHNQKPATEYHIALVILPPIKQISFKLL
jgi:hypothetical protein